MQHDAGEWSASKPSPAHSTPNGYGQVKRKKSQPREDEIDSSDESEQDGRKRKRNRMSLACSSCKRRKIKCDRMLPVCGPCSKRGQGSTCQFDALVQHELPPTIARSAEVQALLMRVNHVERYLASLPPNYATFKPYVPKEGDDLTSTAAALAGSHSHPHPDRGSRAHPGPDDETLSETEDAAVSLEAGVFAKELRMDLGAGRVGGRGGEAPVAAGSTATRELRFGGKPVELTKALTSIVAPERALASSRYALDVDFDASEAELAAARKVALRRLRDALPERAVQFHLVHLYFGSVSWLFHVLHPSCFLIELEAFHAMIDAGRETEVDVLFVGLLLMVLCVSLDSTHASRSPLSLDPAAATSTNPLSSVPDETLRLLPEHWFATAQRALSLGEWETYPRIRTLQTIVLFTQYLQLSSANRGQPSQLVTWLAGAIRQAQCLGLNRLGSNPEIMPADDPAWPPGKNSLKRESAKRLWAVLVYQDWLGASSRNRSYLIHPLHFDTDDPSNLNDADLSPIDWRINPAPASVLTDTSSDRIRIAMARQVRQTADTLILSKREVTHEVILELDRGYRDILDNLPDRYIVESSREETEQPMLRFQRHFALEGIHNRLFRLHRPFSTRGYRNPTFRNSTDACIKSARIVIVSTHNIRFATRDIWFSYSHVMGAALVLFNDLFQAIDSDAPAAEIDSTRSTLLLAAEIFGGHAQVASPSLAAVVQQGSLIISGLLRAEESRRATRAAQTLLSASGVEGDPDEPVEEPETFAEVLQRVSRSLNAHEARHRGTPPPTRNIPSKKDRAGVVAAGSGLTASGFPMFGTAATLSGPPGAATTLVAPTPVSGAAAAALAAFDPTSLAPWPFPGPGGAAGLDGFGNPSPSLVSPFLAGAGTSDELGYSFFSDMEMSTGGVQAGGDDLWSSVGGLGGYLGDGGVFGGGAGGEGASGWDGLGPVQGQSLLNQMGGW